MPAGPVETPPSPTSCYYPLFGWWAGAVFADRNAPALGSILDQQRVSNSTLNGVEGALTTWV